MADTPVPTLPPITPCPIGSGFALKYCWNGDPYTLTAGTGASAGNIRFDPSANPPLYISTIEADFTRLLPEFEKRFAKKE
jgi:hypothetical protein